VSDANPGLWSTPRSAVARWEALVRRRREQFERLRGDNRAADSDAYWRRLVGKYYQAVRGGRGSTGAGPIVRAALAACEAAAAGTAIGVEPSRPDTEVRLSAGGGGTISPRRATVLDVGGGFGAVAIPLARAGHHVTVVEPSPAMREYLDRWVTEEGLAELVATLPTGWMEAATDRHDVVLCVNVLYPIEAIEPFLGKLRSATGHACLAAMRTSAWEIAPAELFRELHGEERIPPPTFGDLCAVLGELAVPFAADFAAIERDWSYADLDEAEEVLAETLLVAERPAQRRRVREWAAANLVPRGGRLEVAAPDPGLEGIATIWPERGR
jgi:2-polyprenyl-3-methyl-5-hydroxy-6-metoxy-1,4-benzoquinol methylase